MLEGVLERGEVGLARRTSRRSFLGKVGKGVMALAGGGMVASALAPERAEAHHICGHTYTTGSCPHPYAPLTRIDTFGKPLHPKKGYPIDDNGKLYTSREQPRHSICGWRVPQNYPIAAPTSTDGTWSACCYGRIRRIVDCCSYSDTRINGDASVTGYCYNGRKVFCIMYRVTDTTC
jgi:hypothetical protein